MLTWFFHWGVVLQSRIHRAEGEQTHRSDHFRSSPQSVDPERVCSSGERHPPTPHTISSCLSKQPSPLLPLHCLAPHLRWPCLLRLRPWMVVTVPIASAEGAITGPTVSSALCVAPKSAPGRQPGDPPTSSCSTNRPASHQACDSALPLSAHPRRTPQKQSRRKAGFLIKGMRPKAPPTPE